MTRVIIDLQSSPDICVDYSDVKLLAKAKVFQRKSFVLEVDLCYYVFGLDKLQLRFRLYDSRCDRGPRCLGPACLNDILFHIWHA